MSEGIDEPDKQDVVSSTTSADIELRLDGSRAAGRRESPTRPRVFEDAGEPSTHQLSVLIPARNEEQNLQGCLESLAAQSEAGFVLGERWRVFIIDDGSTDDTLRIAEEFSRLHAGVHVLRAPELPLHERGFTGKNAALWFGVSQPEARSAEWLLFTDADTIHQPGSTHRAIVEAERHSLGTLSYSPRQIAANVWQRALQPLIFSELATTYPPKKVSDPSNPVAAANGQFLLVKRAVYFSVGGHQSVADRVLEDVALARLIKRRHAIRLRYAPEAVAARMYRTTSEMIAGWTKNLALLFGKPLFLALSRLLDFLLLLGLPLALLLMHLLFWQRAAMVLLWLRVALRYYTRVSRSGAPLRDVVLSVLALPLFVFVLIRSWQRVSLHRQVIWKGRTYHP